MKATLLTSAIALFALSAAASPQQTAQPQPAPAEQQAANVPQQTLTEPASVQQGDSPLVAAAKRAGRLGKKPSQVITNETLVKTGGHVTTTKTQDPIPSQAVAQTPSATPLTTAAPAAAAAAAPAQTAAQKRKAADEQAKKDTAAAKEKALKRAVADYMGESIEEVNDDPNMQEAVAAQASAPTAAPRPQAAQPPSAPAKPPSR